MKSIKYTKKSSMQFNELWACGELNKLLINTGCTQNSDVIFSAFIYRSVM